MVFTETRVFFVPWLTLAVRNLEELPLQHIFASILLLSKQLLLSVASPQLAPYPAISDGLLPACWSWSSDSPKMYMLRILHTIREQKIFSWPAKSPANLSQSAFHHISTFFIGSHSPSALTVAFHFKLFSLSKREKLKNVVLALCPHS